MRLPGLYFDWLQKDNPTGTVDRLPQLRNKFETSVPGIYCTGDLTGIPLIKLAAESGFELMERFRTDEEFRRKREQNRDADVLDMVIVGAGPSGISAAIRSAELGYRIVILESSRLFNTIENFPAGKPIYVTPPKPPMKSALHFTEGTRETLLEQLHDAIRRKDLPVRQNEMVKTIEKKDGTFTVKTEQGAYRALRVVLSIGKTGNARRLGVEGEELPKVFTRLIDPGEHHDQDILVVGGGDSALEAAVALAKTDNRVTLSYRRNTLTRPKEQNVRAFEKLAHEGKITSLPGSTVKEVREHDVVLRTAGGEKTLPNDTVFALIGTEIPVRFFKRAGIRLQGEKRFADWSKLAALLLFSCVLYFGKSAPVTKVSSAGQFLTIPARLLKMNWVPATKGLLAWISFILMTLAGTYLVGHVSRNRSRYFGTPWNSFKYSYFGAMFALFAIIYITHNLAGFSPLGYHPGVWYTAMYSLTILVFGLRRMKVTPTGYIRRQTWTLIGIQMIPLFILPIFVFEPLGRAGLLPQWLNEQAFPGGSYWRSYGFILAWPLFIHNLATNQPTLFWGIVGVGQAFLLIPLMNYLWGKGAYCGWVCSCGALAETLGDEYRTEAWHGPAAKRADNAGQVVLWFAAIVTLAVLVGKPGGGFGVNQKAVYEIVVDIVFAGVLGVGVYFFLSGRVWCRFLCPLAALMHIYTRFSKYRIMADKKRCISCGICTKVCHMGIDVMGYANKGIPMNDVECVRCSACIVNCPMQVLTFGNVGKPDPDNREHTRRYIPLTSGWQSGLPDNDIAILKTEEREKHPEVGH